MYRVVVTLNLHVIAFGEYVNIIIFIDLSLTQSQKPCYLIDNVHSMNIFCYKIDVKNILRGNVEFLQLLHVQDIT